MPKRKRKGWRKEFLFGSALSAPKVRANIVDGCTPDRDSFGRPRELDFEHYDAVDWGLNDAAEDFS